MSTNKPHDQRARRSVIEHVDPSETLRLATAHEVACSEGYAESMIREMCERLAERIAGARAKWGQS